MLGRALILLVVLLVLFSLLTTGFGVNVPVRIQTNDAFVNNQFAAVASLMLTGTPVASDSNIEDQQSVENGARCMPPRPS